MALDVFKIEMGAENAVVETTRESKRQERSMVIAHKMDLAKPVLLSMFQGDVKGLLIFIAIIAILLLLL